MTNVQKEIDQNSIPGNPVLSIFPTKHMSAMEFIYDVHHC